MKNYLTNDELAQYELSENDFSEYNRYMVDEISIIKRFEDFGDVIKLFSISEYPKGTFVPEYYTFGLMYEGVVMEFVKHHWKDKGFHFELPRLSIDTAYGSAACYKEPRPNMIGTPTKKKLDNYLKYLKDKRQFKLDYHVGIVSSHSKFFSKLLEIDPENKCDKQSGDIRKNGIRLTYNIMSDGKIYTNIDIHSSFGGSDFDEPVELFKLDLFKALSDNKIQELVSSKTRKNKH